METWICQMRLLVRCMSRRAFMSVRICLHWEPPLTVGDRELANHFASTHNIQFSIVNTSMIINPHICVRIQRVLFQVHKAAKINTSSRTGGVILSTPPSVLSPELVLSGNRRFDHPKKDHWIRRKTDLGQSGTILFNQSPLSGLLYEPSCWYGINGC